MSTKTLTDKARAIMGRILDMALAETEKGVVGAERQRATLDAWLKGARARQASLSELATRLKASVAVEANDVKMLRELANSAPYGMVREVMGELEKEG